MKAVVRIKGYRGTWYADVAGMRLPVLHDTWWTPPHTYYDPMVGAKLDGGKYIDLVERLSQSDLCIIQRDKDEKLSRAGYLGVFKFGDLVVGTDGSIALKIIQRVASSDR